MLLGQKVLKIEDGVAPKHLKPRGRLRAHLELMIELRRYLRKFQEQTICYSRAHRAKVLVSTAPVESLRNSLINRRMNKKQQMSWTKHGANCVVPIRVAMANRVFGNIVEQ
jgi:hypothetical protein